MSNLPLRRVALAAVASCATALVVAVPSAHADDPVVTVDDGVVEYADPALDAVATDTDTVEGTLRLAHVDDHEAGDVRLAAIEQADGDLVPIELAEELPADAADGQVVAEVVADDGATPRVAEATVEPAAQEAAPAGAQHRLWVAMPTTSGTLPSDAEVSASLDVLANEWSSDAEGQIGSFDVAKVVRYSSSQTQASLCGMSNVWGAWQEAAAKVGWTNNAPPASSTGTDHLVVVLSGASSCTSQSGALGVGTLHQGFAGSEGSRMTVSWRSNANLREGTLIHEMGHNFGLGHANVRNSSSSISEYLNIYSVMGFGTNGASPALGSAFREVLGSLRSGEVQTVAANDVTRTVTLAPRGSASGLRGLKVTDTSGNAYWVEYRLAVGRDVAASYEPYNAIWSGRRFGVGVTVSRIVRDSDGWPTLQLYPQSSTDSAYHVGDSFAVPGTNGVVRVTDLGSSAATVTVGSGAAAPTPTTPTPAPAPTPTITGTPMVGRTLTAGPTGTGYTYQWYRGTTAISRATASTRVLSASDRGHTISVAVRRDGTLIGTAKTRTVVAPGRISLSAPRVSGTVARGKVVTAVVSSEAPGLTYSYRWYADGKAISGATRSWLKVSSTQRNKSLRVKVTARKSGYTTEVRYSSTTSRVR